LAQSRIETPKKKAPVVAKPIGEKVLPTVNDTYAPLGEEKLILDLNEIFGDKVNARPEGPRTGGGGNSCALAIVENTSRLRGQLELIGNDLLGSLQNKSSVLAVMAKARFYIADRLILNGQSKDAINYPHDGVIVLSRNFCSTEMIEPTGRSMSLLLHEFLGLARLDDRHYQISRAFLDRYAEIASDEFKIRQYLSREAAKDLAGKRSCFKGAIKAKDKDMEEMYGGRYTSETPKINLHLAAEESSRQVDKYCDVYLDKNKKPTEDSDKAIYKICGTHTDQTYVVSAGFDFATSGSFGTEAALFNVAVERTHSYVFRIADYDLETEVGVEEGKSSETITCRSLPVPESDK
jgi:hypothetical protein